MGQQQYDPRNPKPGVYIDQPTGQSFDHVGREYHPINWSGALDKLKGLMPQSTPEHVGPPPKSPGAPPWTNIPTGNKEPGEFDSRVGRPNVPYLDDSYPNDDPNVGIRAQLSQIDPKTAPGVLNGLRSAGGMDASKLYALQDKMRDDVALNLDKARGAGSTFMTGATPTHLAQLNDDLAPLDQYRAQEQDYAKKQYEANVGGFESPQEAAGFGQALESRKATAPTDVAKIQAQGNLSVQESRNKSSDDFFERLMQMRAAGIDPGTIIRGPNGIQFSTAPVSNSAQGNSEKNIEQLSRDLYLLEHPTQLGPIPLKNPWQDTKALVAAKKADLANAVARSQGRTPAPTPTTQASGMNHVTVGTKGTIKGVPVTWDGTNWIAED